VYGHLYFDLNPLFESNKLYDSLRYMGRIFKIYCVCFLKYAVHVTRKEFLAGYSRKSFGFKRTSPFRQYCERWQF